MKRFNNQMKCFCVPVPDRGVQQNIGDELTPIVYPNLIRLCHLDKHCEVVSIFLDGLLLDDTP